MPPLRLTFYQNLENLKNCMLEEIVIPPEPERLLADILSAVNNYRNYYEKKIATHVETENRFFYLWYRIFADR